MRSFRLLRLPLAISLWRVVKMSEAMDDGSEGGGCEKAGEGFVVGGSEASELLGPGKEVLYAAEFAMPFLVEGEGLASIGFDRDTTSQYCRENCWWSWLLS